MKELKFVKKNLDREFVNSFWYKEYQKEKSLSATREELLSWIQHFYGMFLQDIAIDILEELKTNVAKSIIIKDDLGKHSFPIFDEGYEDALLEEDILFRCQLQLASKVTIKHGIARVWW